MVANSRRRKRRRFTVPSADGCLYWSGAQNMEGREVRRFRSRLGIGTINMLTKCCRRRGMLVVVVFCVFVAGAACGPVCLRLVAVYTNPTDAYVGNSTISSAVGHVWPLQKPVYLQFLWPNATLQASRPSLLNRRRSCQPCVASRSRPTKLSAWFAHNQQARSRVPVYALGGGTTAVATELLEDNGGPSITNAAEWLWAG